MGIFEEMRDILRKSGKAVTLMASLLVVLGLAVGGTVALLFDITEPVENNFTTAKVTTGVDENFVNGVKSNVKIRNTGDTEAWIRAAVVVTWQDAQGNVLGEAPKAGTDYTIVWNYTKWVTGNDGFYYYTDAVAASAATGELITSCEPVEGKTPDGYNLCVEILGSGIQSWPLKVFNTESGWGTSSGLTASASPDSQDGTKTLSNSN